MATSSFCRRLSFRPDADELDEFHPRASRYLFVGGLPRDPSVAANTLETALRDRFSAVGEILDVDVVRRGHGHSIVQFGDVVSVVRAIQREDGAELSVGGVCARVKLAFGRPVPSKCVWCQGLPEDVSDKVLRAEFGRFGKLQDLLTDRPRGTALIYFDQVGFNRL
jgi:RNA recognition motif-containing protein